MFKSRKTPKEEPPSGEIVWKQHPYSEMGVRAVVGNYHLEVAGVSDRAGVGWVWQIYRYEGKKGFIEDRTKLNYGAEDTFDAAVVKVLEAFQAGEFPLLDNDAVGEKHVKNFLALQEELLKMMKETNSAQHEPD